MDNTKKIAEYGMISALLAALMIGSQYLPILGTVLLVVLPAPVVYISIKYNLLGGLSVSLVAGLVSMPLLTPIFALFYALISAGVGSFIALGLKRRFEPLLAIFLSSMVIVALTFATSFLMVEGGGVSLRESITQTYKESFDMTKSIFQEYKALSPGDAALLDEKMNQWDLITRSMTAIMNLLFPSMVLSMGLLYSLLVYIITGKLLRRFNLGFDIAYPKPFSDFSYPKHFAYGTTGMLLLSYLLSKLGLVDGDLILSNLAFIIIGAFFVQGLAVIYHFMLRKQKKPMAIFLTILFTLAVILIFSLDWLSLLGFVDVFVNFRKRRKQVR